jgi:UDP-galactopyranose mutase
MNHRSPSGAHFSCIGLRGVRPVPAPLMRFPDSRFTIHDAAMLSEIAPGCVPSRDKYRALVAETAFSECRPLPAEPLARAMDALVSCGVLNDNDRERVVSSLEETVEYYRPASTASRDAALRTIQPHLESLGIYSRGLFGGWKAEAGSLEQCMAQGAEWAERLLLGKTEQTYRIGEQ